MCMRRLNLLGRNTIHSRSTQFHWRRIDQCRNMEPTNSIESSFKLRKRKHLVRWTDHNLKTENRSTNFWTNSERFCAAYSSYLPQYFFNSWQPELDMSFGYALNEIGRDRVSSDELILIFALEKIRRTPLFTWFNRFLLSIRSNDLFYWRKTSNTV